MEKVEKYYSDMGIEFNQNEIDRAHYIGKPYIDEKKNKVQSIMVKFRSWKSSSSFNVSLDLMKRRYNLLIKVKGLITNNPLVAYAFSDVNYSLVLKFNDNTYRYFNGESELNNLSNPEFKRNQFSFIKKNTRLFSCLLFKHY